MHALGVIFINLSWELYWGTAAMFLIPLFRCLSSTWNREKQNKHFEIVFLLWIMFVSSLYNGHVSLTVENMEI